MNNAIINLIKDTMVCILHIMENIWLESSSEKEIHILGSYYAVLRNKMQVTILLCSYTTCLIFGLIQYLYFI